VRGKQARAREKESKRDRTPQGCKEREKKNALQSNGRLFDALPLVVVRVLVGDGDDVLFSSFFLALHFSLALFFALHATSGLSSHTMLPVLLTTNRFFFRCSSFSPQKDQRQRQKKCNNNLFSFIIIIIIIISLLQAYDTSI
jgi:hypothetical protein